MVHQLLLPPEDLNVKQRERPYQSVLEHAQYSIDVFIVLCICGSVTVVCRFV